MSRLLLITRNAWSDNISTGNTMSNFFGDWQGEIANIYCREEQISNKICKRYFQITETQLIYNIFKKQVVGKEYIYDDFTDFNTNTTYNNSNEKREKKMYLFFKTHRLQLFLWARELLWKTGKWKNDNLDKFIDEFSPDIILMPLYDCFYMYDILFYVHKKSGAKIALYTGDDMYTLKQISFSPLYWIDRLIRRKKIREAVKISDFRFCLTEKQSLEYTKIFSKKFETLMKGANTYTDLELKDHLAELQFVYTGNIFSGRYKTLCLIGKALKEINSDDVKARLHIYSGNKLNAKIKKKFDENSIIFHGSVDAERVKEIQRDADVLIHVEDFALKNLLKVRLSMSTKIVDYLAMGKCVFAVAPANVASMEYLRDNDAAVCVSDRGKIKVCIQKLLDNRNIINEYEENALKCIRKNHDMKEIRNRLYNRLESIVNEGGSD